MKQYNILIWRNKFSGETGYVATVSAKKGYFTSTKNRNLAKKYISSKILETDMKLLESFGEFNNNDFAVEEL